MFDLDTFVEDCVRARREGEPRLAIKEVLEKAVLAARRSRRRAAARTS